MLSQTKEEIRSVLEKAKAHIELVGTDAPSTIGCLEDGLCQTLMGRTWFFRPGDDFAGRLATLEGMKAHPAYALLLAKAKAKGLPFTQCCGESLWSYSDKMNKKQRIALIDEVIGEL